MRRVTVFLIGLTLFVAGCGDKGASPPMQHGAAPKQDRAGFENERQVGLGGEGGFGGGQGGFGGGMGGFAFPQNRGGEPPPRMGPIAGADLAKPRKDGNADNPPAMAKQPAPEAPVVRRIIYSASIDLIVTDFDGSGKNVQTIVDYQGGYVAKSDVGEVSGERRRATWTLRVPVAKFRETMDALAQIGHAVSTKHDSQDITDEFYDLEARLKNKRVEEERLLDHLKKSTGKLDEILTVEKELSRVRGEIEATQGRLQKLAKLSELTTIIVSMQEQKDYVPPTAPTYSSSVGQTFGESVNALSSFFKSIGLVIAALVPWSPFILVAGGVIVLMVRRSHRKPAAQP